MTGPVDPADAADPGDAKAAHVEPAEGASAHAEPAEETQGEPAEGTQVDGGPVAGPEAWNIVAVADVAMNLPSAHPEIVLHEAQHPWRELRIPVGLAEGTAIAYAFRGVETPRPLSHELFSELLDRHGVTIEAVRVTVRRGQVFFAELDTMGPKGRRVVPCRPSDAIALALRQRMPTPLLVAEWVFTGADAPAGFTSAGTTPGVDGTEP